MEVRSLYWSLDHSATTALRYCDDNLPWILWMISRVGYKSWLRDETSARERRLSLLSKMQSIQNSAARIVSRKRLHNHISPIVNELHWLPVEKRIIFKLLIMAYKCNQGVAPQYLLDIVKSYQPARHLRSSSITLLTPYSAITKGYGQRAFQYAIPMLWNSLPNHLRECQFFEQSKTKLKTYLFSSN